MRKTFTNFFTEDQRSATESRPLMRGWFRWSDNPPPFGVPLKIFCGIKRNTYHRSFTREELEAWAAKDADIEPVDWTAVGWNLTGIAKEMLA